MYLRCHEGPWAGELHFSAVLLDDASVATLEQYLVEQEKPRHLHVFFSNRSPALGDVNAWIHAPKYGGVSGLETLEDR